MPTPSYKERKKEGSQSLRNRCARSTFDTFFSFACDTLSELKNSAEEGLQYLLVCLNTMAVPLVYK